MEVLYISCGAVVGALARWQVVVLGEKYQPYMTMTVNALGSFMLGAFLGWSEVSRSDSKYELIFTVGFCGSFTTFSGFAVDTLVLFKTGRVLEATVLVLTTNVSTLT